MNEYALSVNNFNRPEIKKDVDAIYLLLIRLLLRVPGSSQTHPKMGVGLIERFRYIDMDNLNELQDEIHSQISSYLPQFQAVTVEIGQYGDKDIQIKITIDKTLYIFNTDYDKKILKLADI